MDVFVIDQPGFCPYGNLLIHFFFLFVDEQTEAWRVSVYIHMAC